MTPMLWAEAVIFAILMALSAFFSSSETALFSLSTTQITRMRREGHPRAELIEQLLERPRRLIVTILLGNELVNVAGSVISAAIVIEVLGPGEKWVNLLIMIPVLLLVGEITPKTLAMNNNERFASFESRPIELFARLIAPVRRVVRVVADFFITLIVGKERSRGNIITEDMVRVLAHEAVGEGELDGMEAQFIEQIFDFGNLTLEEVMTPRSDTLFLPFDSSLQDVVAEVRRTRHTKIPIFRGHRDHIVGILHARDLVGKDLDKLSRQPGILEKLLRQPYLVPETKPASDLFRVFRERRLSLALLIDEYGGITGLVTMEDLLECIFGEIHSPSDVSRRVLRTHLGQLRVDGAMELDAFNRQLGAAVESEHAQTVGGLLLHELGELPYEGASIRKGGLELIVQEVADNRIKTVLVKDDYEPLDRPRRKG